MKKFKILTILILASCTISPNFNANNADMLQGKTLNINTLGSELKTNLKKDNYKLIYYFNGDCSACIAEFIEWIKKWNVFYTGDRITCLFISTSFDKYILEHYMEISNVTLKENQNIYIDNKQQLIADNNFLNDKYNVILVNKENRIIETRDPFSDKESAELYKNIISKIK